MYMCWLLQTWDLYFPQCCCDQKLWWAPNHTNANRHLMLLWYTVLLVKHKRMSSFLICDVCFCENAWLRKDRFAMWIYCMNLVFVCAYVLFWWKTVKCRWSRWRGSPLFLLLVLSCSWRSRVSPCERLRGHCRRRCVSTFSGSSSTWLFSLCWVEPSTLSTSPRKHHRTWYDFDAEHLVFFQCVMDLVNSFLISDNLDCVS